MVYRSEESKNEAQEMLSPLSEHPRQSQTIEASICNDGAPYLPLLQWIL